MDTDNLSVVIHPSVSFSTQRKLQGHVCLV